MKLAVFFMLMAAIFCLRPHIQFNQRAAAILSALGLGTALLSGGQK